MRFYTTLKLGPHREKTWDGFTIFRNVSVSRVGEQIYGPDEGIGVKPGPDDRIRIMRKPEEVFRQETLDSGNCKSLVLEHPDNDDERLPDVRPENWRELSHGVMVSLRRGTGDQSEESVADIFVGSDEILREIDLGLRELSLGYTADYFEIEPGRGEQRNILINHVALVEAGRCGSRCAVRDHKPKEGCMKKGKTWLDRLVAVARSAKDEEAAKKAVEEMQDEDESGSSTGETHIHVHTGAAAAAPKVEDEEEKDPTEKRFKAIEDSIAKLADSMKDRSRDAESEEEKAKKEEAEKREKAADAETEGELEEETGTADARKAHDSALLSEVFENVKMHAEIIAPGVAIPTFDAKGEPKKMFRDCVCGLRRAALKQATTDTATAELITVVRGRTLDAAEVAKLPCGQVRAIFNGVAAMKRAANNGAITRDGMSVVKPTAKTGDQLSPSERFKAASAKRWGGK